MHGMPVGDILSEAHGFSRGLSRKVETRRRLVLRRTAILISFVLLTGCATHLRPVSGGFEGPDGNYLINGSEKVQIKIIRAGIDSQLGWIYVVLENTSREPVEIDYTQTIITTHSGERLQPFGPIKAASSIKAFSGAKPGSRSALQSTRRYVMKNGIGKLTIQPGELIEGAFFFEPPSQIYYKLIFKFNGIPGSPQLTLNLW